MVIQISIHNLFSCLRLLLALNETYLKQRVVMQLLILFNNSLYCSDVFSYQTKYVIEVMTIEIVKQKIGVSTQCYNLYSCFYCNWKLTFSHFCDLYAYVSNFLLYIRDKKHYLINKIFLMLRRNQIESP